MTGSSRRGDTPMGPPWPVDVLADLHAGVFDDAADLLPRARQDPDARAVLDALDATRAELGGLTARPAPMPERFAARLDAAIAAEAKAMFPAATPPREHQPRQPVTPEQGPVAPVVDLAAARKRRNQRVGWGVGTLVAAAAVAVAVIVIPHGKQPLGGVAAAPPTSTDTGVGSAPPGGEALTSGDLNASTLGKALGRTDYGPYTDQAKRSACLAANGADPDRTPAGAMQVTLDGKPGTLMVLTTGRTAQFRLLVVGPDCAAGHPDTIADHTIGGITPTTR
ncbi:MAG TPA: hypothetical protein VHF06_07170 [Pseudonocardiaceae bacterium]|jgi:hypothetical protein|nr:hypothetical protein [Pseudonocardiaceae bacterium]